MAGKTSRNPLEMSWPRLRLGVGRFGSLRSTAANDREENSDVSLACF